jgi:hypothetical protein
MRKGEPQIGESINCDEGRMSGSRTRVCDLSGGVVTTEIGGDRRGVAGGFIDVRFGRSGTDGCFVVSGEDGP